MPPQEEPRPVSRRSFLGGVAPVIGGSALASIVPGSGRAGPNDTIMAGLIGCGSRGPYVAYVHHERPDVEIKALCDVHKGRLAKAKEFIGGLGGRPTLYDDYRKLLDDKSIDVVIVATNAHWHVLPAIDACAAGKDVYLEKPVGTSIAEGRAAARAAKRHGRVVQMGTQQRSWKHYRDAVGIVRSGQLGEISHVHVWDVQSFHPGFGSPPDGAPPPELDWDFWVGPSPKVPYNPNRTKYHYWFFDYGGGWEVAWGVHHYDVVHWAMGVGAPQRASGSGGKLAFRSNLEWPDTFQGACVYPPCPAAQNGFLMTYMLHNGSSVPVEGRGHGKAFYGANGTLILNRQGYQVISETRGDKKVVEERSNGPTEKEHDAVRNHVESFIASVKTRGPSVSDVATGHRSTTPGHLMNIAWRVGREITWDGEVEEITGDSEAQTLVTKEYRKPWRLPS